MLRVLWAALVLINTVGIHTVRAADFRVGAAKIDITPAEPIYLSGYAARTHPSEGVAHPIYVKALAVEDKHGSRVVFVTADVVGLPKSISDLAAAQLQKLFGLDRSRVVFNYSHTHTGPLLMNKLTLWIDIKR